MGNRIAIVVSQSRSSNPAHRALEDAIVHGILERHLLDITIVPNLCDLKPDGPGLMALREIKGDTIGPVHESKDALDDLFDELDELDL
jgi:hypothetical protein